jgi:hypothetical protein
MKTSELSGAALDWAVAKCEGVYFENLREFEDYALNYCTDWEHGGPLIEREGIGLDQYADYPRWQAFTPAPEQPSGHCACTGPTPLIAAMRCYVASKLGDDVEVPEGLHD